MNHLDVMTYSEYRSLVITSSLIKPKYLDVINNREETFDIIILFTESLISRNNFVKDQHFIELNRQNKVKLLFLTHLITYSPIENLHAHIKLHRK